ncbi:hypothetical protein L9W92_08295 [Pelotomaculum terephthalicicum JT]|uniref:hypothetical protein n=1 Tax=Pelotomaculum TaxID=191373 RepID=UPI0009CF17A7|nr:MULTISPECIES: hypothetical protein [Pelotomaculum]MCG9968047.1 hypothetical protein [Pelotomaculum terephthalicicum JT]OPX85656.1 MAG: hypothetical protein A4E54_02356 [Pelotomaculum sp. PtaB.Bin117]OPY63972.1 MAG: hypothetical protein A4E56_00024 [Pelotomaculum sp. PtaU1.Bin065]
MCGLPLWYFYSKETPMNKQLEAILKQVDLLPADQQRELLRILQLLLTIIPQTDPGEVDPS